MDNLIECLQIFRKYGNPTYPFNCNHDELWVNIDPELVSDEDKKKLDELGGFFEDDGGFLSYDFGSC